MARHVVAAAGTPRARECASAVHRLQMRRGGPAWRGRHGPCPAPLRRQAPPAHLSPKSWLKRLSTRSWRMGGTASCSMVTPAAPRPPAHAHRGPPLLRPPWQHALAGFAECAAPRASAPLPHAHPHLTLLCLLPSCPAATFLTLASSRRPTCWLTRAPHVEAVGLVLRPQHGADGQAQQVGLGQVRRVGGQHVLHMQTPRWARVQAAARQHLHPLLDVSRRARVGASRRGASGAGQEGGWSQGRQVGTPTCSGGQ